MRSERYHPKERVLGVTIDGVSKAYPFTELAKTGGTEIDDELEGRRLRIEFDIENKDGSVISEGVELVSINSFWFAWYAFHADTLVYKEAVRE